jgi:hypothetical protein
MRRAGKPALSVGFARRLDHATDSENSNDLFDNRRNHYQKW